MSSGSRRSPSVVKHAKIATLLLPGHRHRARPQGGLRRRRAHRARGHALHRGRRLEPAHRVRAPARHGRRRLPDDEPHDHAASAGRAGQADGKLRRHLLLRGRLRRRAEHERRARPLPRLQGRAEARNADRHARAPQPEPGRGQLASSRSRKAATASTPAWPAWAPAPATRRWKCSSPRPSAWAGTTAPTCTS